MSKPKRYKEPFRGREYLNQQCVLVKTVFKPEPQASTTVPILRPLPRAGKVTDEKRDPQIYTRTAITGNLNADQLEK